MSVAPETLSFECVRPLESHGQLIMEWRNDPLTLKMSFHQQPKIWATFKNEFKEEYFSSPNLPPLFILYKGQRVAFVRFRQFEHPMHSFKQCCEISINVSPPYRGQGIGTQALIALKDWVTQQGYEAIYAEVKKENIDSQKVFLKAGYRQLEDVKKVIEDTGETVEICRFLADLTSSNHSSEASVFVIAEAGSNWRMGSKARDIAMAKTLVDVAVDAGANAVKFQTFRPETVYVKNAGQSDYLAQAGINESIHEIFTDLAMPYEMIPLLAEYCNQQGIEFMSTPFSKEDFLAVDPYVKRHKIASYEINHIRLIELAARSGKPVIMSTGASTENEIAWAVRMFQSNAGKALTLLQCTACYPTEDDSLNLTVIPWLKHRFKVPGGLSDHSRHPLYAPIAATALGASVIEKHFTLNNRLPGPDHAFAITPSELKAMVDAIRCTERMRGPGVKVIHPCESELRAFAKRGIQVIEEIHEGDLFQEGVNIDILRPGRQNQGIHPKFLQEIEGTHATRNIAIGQGLLHGDWY